MKFLKLPPEQELQLLRPLVVFCIIMIIALFVFLQILIDQGYGNA